MIAILLFTALSIQAAQAGTPDCAALLKLASQTIGAPAQNAKIAEWSAYQSAIWQNSKQTAHAIFQVYRTGNVEELYLDRCFPELQDSNTVQELLPQAFYEESLAILRKSSGPTIQKLVAALDQTQTQGELPLFRLTGHFDEESPTQSLAGFHRGQKSIFLDFSRISPNDWLVVLSHELVHSLDQKLMQAAKDYANQATFQAIAAETADPKILETWLIAGLDRGFLAEVRAWTITFQIYQEGLADQLWQHIAWLDEILKQKPENQTLEQFTLAYLDPKFTDPTEGHFAKPGIKQALTELRQSYRNGTRDPDFGNLDYFRSDRASAR